jgi:hypothetical protein
LTVGGEGSITCRGGDEEEIWNPGGGAAGADLMKTFGRLPCTGGVRFCTNAHKLELSQLGTPWSSTLVRERGVRDKIPFGLWLECDGVGRDAFHGNLTPLVKKGKLIFKATTGTLEDSFGLTVTVVGKDLLTAPGGTISAK